MQTVQGNMLLSLQNVQTFLKAHADALGDAVPAATRKLLDFYAAEKRSRPTLRRSTRSFVARDRIGSAANGAVMVAHRSEGPNPTVTWREKVLEGTYLLGRNHPGFDVSADGRIVLVREQRENGRTIVVQGWTHELRALTRKPGSRAE